MASLTWLSASCLVASSFPARASRSGRPSTFARAGCSGASTFFLSVVGRLKPNVSVERANTELEAVAGHWPDLSENVDSTAFAVPLQQDLARNARTSFLLLLRRAAVLVLLIACANVAGLWRPAARTRS